MKTSETIAKITPALLKAQKNMDSAKKSASNPYFKSKYADLNAVLSVVKEALNNEGIVVLQPTITVDGTPYVETVLLHESGEFVSGQTKIEAAKLNDPQALGSATSYARRYGLQSLVGLEAQDDDGESVMSRNKTSAKTNETTAATVQPSVAAEPAVTTESKKTSSFRKPSAKKETTSLTNGHAATSEWE